MFITEKVYKNSSKSINSKENSNGNAKTASVGMNNNMIIIDTAHPNKLLGKRQKPNSEENNSVDELSNDEQTGDMLSVHGD